MKTVVYINIGVIVLIPFLFVVDVVLWRKKIIAYVKDTFNHRIKGAHDSGMNEVPKDKVSSGISQKEEQIKSEVTKDSYDEQYYARLNKGVRSEAENYMDYYYESEPDDNLEKIFREKYRTVFIDEVHKLSETQRKVFSIRIAEEITSFIKNEMLLPCLKDHIKTCWEWLYDLESDPIDLYWTLNDEEGEGKYALTSLTMYDQFQDEVDYLFCFMMALHYFNYLVFYSQDDYGSEDMNLFDLDSIYEVIGFYLRCEGAEEQQISELLKECIQYPDTKYMAGQIM